MSNEWKRNRGRKSLPVPAGTLVDVVHRDGQECLGVPCGVRVAAEWDHTGHPGDIVKWRLHDPSDMDNWKNWKVGDIIEVLDNEYDSSLTVGKHYPIIVHDGNAYCPVLLNRGSKWLYRNSMKWVSRPGENMVKLSDHVTVTIGPIETLTTTASPTPAAPTIDQLIQSWRELTNRAAAAQAEVDTLMAQVNQAADAVTAALAGAGRDVSEVVEPVPDAQIDDDWHLTVKPGDQVECVTIPDEHQGAWFTVGSTYTVGDIDHESPTLQLDVHCNSGFTLWCSATDFRPTQP